MNIRSVMIEGFMSLGYEDDGKEIVLDEIGLLNIIGQNLDDTSAGSNGSGKSSIADAICWALYGKTAKGVSGDDIVNTNTKGGTRVQVIVDDGAGTEYIIDRYRKHKSCGSKLYLGKLDTSVVIPTDLTLSSIKETQERIDQIVGMDYDMFRSSHYMGQEDMPDLPNMTDKELKDVIEKAANITELELAYEEAKKVHKAHKENMDEDISLFKADWNKRRLVWKDYLHNLHQSENFEALNAKLIEDIKANLKELYLELLEREVELGEYQSMANQELLESVNAKIKLCGEVVEVDKKIAKENQVIKESLADVKRAKVKMTSIKEEEAALYHAQCSHCGSELKESKKKDLTDVVTSKRADLSQEAKDLSKRIDNARKSLKSLNIKRDSMPKEDISALTAEKSVIEGNLREITHCESNIKRVNTEIADLDAHLELAEKTENTSVYDLEEIETKLKEAQERIKKGVGDVRNSKYWVDRSKEAVQIFSPAGIRGMILDDVVPYLNGRIEEYLSELSDGNITANLNTLSETKKGEVREKITFEIETTVSKVTNFKLLSGGEKRKVRLASALALQDLVATRSDSSLGIYIADEIDDALDDAGLERLMGILEAKARDKGTVLVISHNSLTDWIRESITVQKKDGISEIVSV